MLMAPVRQRVEMMQAQLPSQEEQVPCPSSGPGRHGIVPTCCIFALHWRTSRATRITFKSRSGPPACEKAGIEWHGVHAFRRGLATILHDLEIDELIISDILRHSRKSSKSVTAKHYIKHSLKRMREALEKVEAKYKAIEKNRGRR